MPLVSHKDKQPVVLKAHLMVETFQKTQEGVTVPPTCESQGETHRVGMSSISDTPQVIGVSTLSREVED